MPHLKAIFIVALFLLVSIIAIPIVVIIGVLAYLIGCSIMLYDFVLEESQKEKK